MKPTPLLDFWQKPPDAGDPIAVLATTFVLEPDFFERDCLARFLAVTSVDEGTGSAADVVARLELEESLREPAITVLADRSTHAERSSLLWDLLQCRIVGGLLHAKVAILLWKDATRVILGSANLTSAGYRTQIELGLAADLGPGCILPPDVLTAIANELESYLELVPGYEPDGRAFRRAAETIALFRDRVAGQEPQRSNLSVTFAPTNPAAAPLDKLESVWHGSQPLRATHLSPFWDSEDATVLTAVGNRLTGRPAAARQQRAAVTFGPTGAIAFSQTLRDVVDDVRELGPLDKEVRLLHAKCLLIDSDQWIAALVGSSNHTKAGLGLSHNRHREMNLWLAAPLTSKEGKALRDLIPLGRPVPPDTEQAEPTDEDENPPPPLPACFGLCRLIRDAEADTWALVIGIEEGDGMPHDWRIAVPGGRTLLTSQQWQAAGRQNAVSIALDRTSTLPLYVTVEWDGNTAPWAVIAEDRQQVPPGPSVTELRADQLLHALATGRTVSAAVRDAFEATELDSVQIAGGVVLDPLARFDDRGSLLRRGRALAASLAALQRRLERPVITLDALNARLASPLGPAFLATKVVEAFESGEQSRADAMFTIAEIALSVGRVDWPAVLEHVDTETGLALVADTFKHLDGLCAGIGTEPADLAEYAKRALKEARRCLTS